MTYFARHTAAAYSVARITELVDNVAHRTTHSIPQRRISPSPLLLMVTMVDRWPGVLSEPVAVR